MKRYNIVVSGFVQGVGFRFFVLQTAVELKMTGWVRNCADSTVELEVQGDNGKITKFVEKIREGSRFSRVSGIEIEEKDIKSGEKSFKIID